MSSFLELKGERFHQITTGTSGVPGRPYVDTRSKYSNASTVVGEVGHVVVDVGSTNSDDRFDTARAELPGIGAIVTSYKEFIHRQVWLVGNDVPETTTCTPDPVNCKRSGPDVRKINQEPLRW